MLNKNEKLFLYGVGALLAIIAISSLKPPKLREVSESDAQQLNFDSSRLPSLLKPPAKLNDNEEIPKSKIPKKSFAALVPINNKKNRFFT